MRTALQCVSCFLLVACATSPNLAGYPDGTPSATGSRHLSEKRLSLLEEAYGNLPRSFEANRGQLSPEVKFLSRGSRSSLFLTGTEAVFVLRSGAGTLDWNKGAPTNSSKARATHEDPRSTVLRVRLLGANPTPLLTGLDELPGKSSYLVGSDPGRWRANVPTYSRIRYERVYPGIDLVYYGNQHRLEYDFMVAPGANTARIRLFYRGEAPNAFAPLRLDANGDLVLDGPDGEIRQHRPRIYQEVDGVRREVAGGYVIRGKHEAGFWLGSYDQARSLVIDPVLAYSTYLGGGADEQGHAIAVDAGGNAYVTGVTQSANFPIAGSVQPPGGSQDVFVAKLNPAGTALVYSTYLGGSAADNSSAIAVDSAGSAYVTGFTDSTNFPVSKALQGNRRGSLDAFVAKLNPTGMALVYSTYLGGSGEDLGAGIAIDTAGNAYLTGVTTSPDFPLANALDASLGGPADAFLAKLNSEGAALVYTTYLGGGGADAAGSIAVDSAGSSYVVGTTTSTDFPTSSAVQSTSGGGISDAFATKLDPAGATLVYSTYLGGSGIDRGLRLALDSTGNLLLVGDTDSPNFPTSGPIQAANGGGIDAFVAKLHSSGSTLTYSTYLGGSGIDAATATAFDSAGNAYVTGVTNSTGFPTAGALQSSSGDGSFDAFVAKLDPAGAALVYSTHFGGSGDDMGFSIAADSAGNAYVVGQTGSGNLPRGDAFQREKGGGETDAFIAKIGSQAVATQLTLFFPRLLTTALGNSSDEHTGIAVANLGSSSGTLSISAYDKSGARIGGPDLVNPAARVLNPGQQIPVVDAQIFGPGIGSHSGWFKVESTVRQIVGFFLMFNETVSILDGADVSSNLRTSFLFPEIEGEGFTEIHVANPQSAAANLSFELMRFDGTLRAPAVRRSINPNGVVAETFDQLFPGLTPSEFEYIRVTADRGVVPFELLGKSGQFVHGLNGQDATAGATTLYSPQYVVGGNAYRSTLSVINLDAMPGTVTFEFIGESGTAIGTRATLPIPAGGKLYVSDQKFFLDAGNTLTQGYVKLTSSGVRLAGSVVYGDAGRSRFSTALPLVSTLLTAPVFGQVASNETFFTGVAILNPNSVGINVTIEIYDAAGVQVASRTEPIAAGRRISRLLTQYFPALVGRNLGSGYIKLRADAPVAAFALFGATDSSSLSAIPSQSVP